MGVGLLYVAAIASKVAPILLPILGFTSLIFFIIGVVFGFKSKKGPNGKRSRKARTGIIIGLIPLINILAELILLGLVVLAFIIG